MGLWNNFLSLFTQGDSEIDMALSSSLAEQRLFPPAFPVYSEGGFTGQFLGISERDDITEEEQRTAWRGIISALVQMRADAIALALCMSEVKRKVGEREFEDVEMDHPWSLLLHNPSSEYDDMFFYEQASKLRDFGRGAYMGVGRDEMGVPRELFIAYPFFGTVRPRGTVTGGIGGFVYTMNGGEVREIDRSEMIWLRHGHPVSPYESGSLLMRSAYESDIDLFQRVYSRDLTKEGNTPPIYGQARMPITERQALEAGDRITKRYRTAGEKQRTLILGNDMTLERLAVNPDDLQYVESARLNMEQILIIYGFPPAMFTAQGIVANSNVARRTWLQQSIKPDVEKLCRSLTKQFKIIFDAEESNLCIVPPDVVPVDRLEQARIDEVKIRNMLIKPSEVRMRDGLPADDELDQYFVGGGIRPLSEVVGFDEEPARLEGEEVNPSEQVNN